MQPSREQVLWIRAQLLSFRHKRVLEEAGQVVDRARRQDIADAILEVFRQHGLPEEEIPEAVE